MRDSPAAAGRAVPVDLNARIASRVSGLRAERAMTLEALAARSAVSRSMISLVERGESSPTAVLLEKIATGLGVPLASLFDDPASIAGPVSRSAERTSWRDPESGYLRCNLSPAGFPSPLRLVEVELPAGARVAYDTAAREPMLHQQIWVLTGRIHVTVGRVTHVLAQGDCLAMRLDEPVAFRNRMRRGARYLVALTTECPRPARPPRR